MVPSPHGTGRRIELEQIWRRRVNKAMREYQKNSSEETRAKLQDVLRIFTEFVLEGKTPPEDAA